MVEPDCFLRQPLAGGEPASDLAPHLRLLAHFVPPPCMPICEFDGDELLLRFDHWSSLEAFLAVIATHALDQPTMAAFLTSGVHWRISMDVSFGRSVEDPFIGSVCARPTLRLTRAAVVALALTVAFRHWFDEGEDRTALVPVH